jgi:hypothetical protein
MGEILLVTWHPERLGPADLRPTGGQSLIEAADGSGGRRSEQELPLRLQFCLSGGLKQRLGI